MKAAALTIALLISGAAFAQTDETVLAYDGDGVATAAYETEGATVGGAGTTVPTASLVQPSNSNPERDARGIAVISDPAVVPAGWNSGPAMGGPAIDPAMRTTSMPSTDSYPPCSRTVTDNCVQTYERGRSPR